MVLGVTVMAFAATIVGVTSLNRARVAFEEDHARSFTVGDCVVVPSSEPNTVRAKRAPCTEDPSYTVGALATGPGADASCPSLEYQHFSTEVADESTAGLCLVPNLVADHCYLLQMPTGAMQRADCDASSVDPAGGLLVQVTDRHDVHDRQACPNDGNQYVWPYPSPQRTYCTMTLFN